MVYNSREKMHHLATVKVKAMKSTIHKSWHNNAYRRTAICVAVFAVALLNAAFAEVYTWTGSTSAIWNKTDANWDKGVWVDGNIAKFPDGVSVTDITLGADVTATLTGARAATAGEEVWALDVKANEDAMLRLGASALPVFAVEETSGLIQKK